ncbi:hypothetical protein COL5a_009879 [Colletotrichum fioriniae]|nr:hypothetical protein COL5a_009879 [Colletotrichum fioriniae]
MALPDHGGHPTTEPSMQHQHQHPQHPPTGMTTTSHAMMSAGPMPMTTMSDTLDFTTPGSILDEAMRLQLQSIYFTKFHPQWPLLHRETFETTAQPKLLMQAVMTVGLWFASWPDARNLAIKFHDSLLVETGNKLLDLLEQSRQGMLSPRMDLLPVFQSMLISTILVPYRADQSMDNVMMTHAMLLETFKATGVYEQSKINLGSQLCGHSGYPWIFKELYQRLAVFQFKLHLILQTIFITIHPALRLSRNAEPGMLRIKIPLPLMMWDGPAAHWYGMVPTDPALLDANAGDEEVLMISKMCEKASLTMDNKALVPLLSWDRCLGYQFGTDKIAMHSILKLNDKDTIVKLWFRGWDFGRVYGPAMVVGTAAVFGFLAWNDGIASPAFPFNLAAGLLMGAVGPYTQFRIFPVNDKLLEEHQIVIKAEKTDERAEGASLEVVRGWAADWKRLDIHRQLLAYLAAGAGLIAVLRS